MNAPAPSRRRALGQGPSRFLAPALLTLALAASACSSSSPSGATASRSTPGGSTSGSVAPARPAALALRPLHVASGTRPHLADAQDREVLLRGVNVNSWGDYYQANPQLPPTVPVTDEDWDQMAALGFSGVRLIVSWSRLEPQRGRFDEAYIDEVRAGIEAAAKRGIYVVVDMHQDAWGKYIASPPGTTCPQGREPAIGWDGAPEWATITDGADTCRVEGKRELSDAVGAAFRNFYADRDGIRAELASAWGHLAGRLADEPAVAGYDLFNEPNAVGPLTEIGPQYAAFVADAIAAIRAAEKQAGGPSRVVFVEPIVVWPLPGSAPEAGFTDDPNVAFAPHNYFESISTILTVDQGFYANTNYAAQHGMALWTGEYGWWDTKAENLARLRRYAAA